MKCAEEDSRSFASIRGSDLFSIDASKVVDVPICTQFAYTDRRASPFHRGGGADKFQPRCDFAGFGGGIKNRHLRFQIEGVGEAFRQVESPHRPVWEENPVEHQESQADGDADDDPS